MTPLRLQASALALVVAAALGTLGFRAFEPPDAVTVDDALDRFRATPVPTPSATPGVPTAAPTATTNAPRASGTATARPGAVPTSAAPVPSRSAAATGIAPLPEGVYVWATTGYETGSAGPATQRHDYPAETTTIVRRDGCAASMRWEPVEDRWDDVVVCAQGNVSRIRVYDTFHTFFGVSERHRYECSGDAWFRPPSTKAGYRWAFDCVSDGARTHTEARVVGIERVTVGDGAADALHVRFDTTMTGRTEGTNPSDYWLALHEPFLLRKTGRVDAQVHTGAGTLDYHEEYDVRLTSRRPRT